MAESKQETDLETIYDEKLKLLAKWNNYMNLCLNLLEDMQLNPDKITEYHDMDPLTRYIRFTEHELDILLEGSSIWILYLGFKSEWERIFKTMPNFEGMDEETKRQIYTLPK